MEKTAKKELQVRALHLKPIIILGQNGLTPAVRTEIDRALYDHELIKIRINQQSRETIQAFVNTISSQQQAELIQLIGHTAIFYRKSSKFDKKKKASSPRKKTRRKTSS